MTGVSPSFRVGVSFRVILLCLILKLGFSSSLINPKLPLDKRIYTLTAGRVLNTNMFQINLGKLLFRATFKVRLGSCLSTALEIANFDSTKINAHFTACLWEGLIHEWKHRLLASPSPLCQ